jgi:hypothetical protein
MWFEVLRLDCCNIYLIRDWLYSCCVHCLKACVGNVRIIGCAECCLCVVLLVNCTVCKRSNKILPSVKLKCADDWWNEMKDVGWLLLVMGIFGQLFMSWRMPELNLLNKFTSICICQPVSNPLRSKDNLHLKCVKHKKIKKNHDYLQV